MESKLPISENQIRITFSWYNAFDKSSWLSSDKAALASASYEKICLLFNIGALQSQIAATQNLNSDDGLKTAAKYFQASCGAFEMIKDKIFSVLHQIPTSDLSLESLTALMAIMLAQAQEAFCLKAIQDKMKDSIIAKVAAQTSDFYNAAAQAASVTSLRQQWEKEWIPVLSAKKSYFLALAEYHQASVAKEKGGYGEQVFRLKTATDRIAETERTSQGMVNVKVWHDKISRAYSEAKKDNDFIYHEQIPRADTLPAIGRATLAKSIAVGSSPVTSNFKDMFEKLVPTGVHLALQAFESRQAEITNIEVGRSRSATQELKSLLASLNLPAALEDLSGEQVPKSVLEKAAAMREKGGLGSIDHLLQALPDLLNRNREILDEAIRLLDEEERQDTEMRDHFKEKWTPKSSADLTVNLREECAKYRAIVENATNADKLVKEKYSGHRKAMELLSRSDNEIAESLPRVESSGNKASPAVMELRNLMEEVETIQAEREAVESEFLSPVEDMAPKFLSALAADGSITDIEGITSSGLEAKYNPLREQVEESLKSQESLITQIKEANDKFVAEKTSGQVASEREKLLKDLAVAYDVYTELTSNLMEGTKFYNDLTEILLKYQSKISDLVFARKTEKDDLSRELQQSLANAPANPVPNPPKHHEAPTAPPRPSRPPRKTDSAQQPSVSQQPSVPQQPPAPQPYTMPQQPNVPQQFAPQAYPYPQSQAPGFSAAPSAPYPSPPRGYQPMPPPGYQQYYAPPGGIASIAPGQAGYPAGNLPATWHYQGQGYQQPTYPYNYPYQTPPGGYPRQ